MPPGLSVSVAGHIAEVFRSWQGEGLLLGRRQVFVRLAGCTVGCRYCDTAWAFTPPSGVSVPAGDGSREPNPVTVARTLELVDGADPPSPLGLLCSVSITGGEPIEQPDFTAALLTALASRGVLLETSGLDGKALGRLAPLARWVGCDLKLPSATGREDVLDVHESVLASGVLRGTRTFFKLVADGDTSDDEVQRAAAILARHAPGSPVFLQPVTPLGGSPALPAVRLGALADILAAQGLDLRVVPQVHRMLGVR